MVSKTGRSSFQTIKDDIFSQIKAGRWKPGETIPGEEDLALQYGCSRMTVNRAIRELAAQGVVERRRQAGTRVAVQSNRSAQIQIPIVRKEIESRGATYRYVLLERKQLKAPEGIAAKLTLPTGTQVLYLRCLHFSDDMAYQYEERWINLARVPAAGDECFESQNPNEWLIAKEPFSEAEHVFSAQIADEQTSELLAIKQGAPLFVVERRTWQGKDTITAVRLSHPGETYKLVSRG